jgi:AraC family transcriptional regulator, regulatory protein of adaptative response / methylated-DNA-[protein]-cysteine methyltransferase
MEIKISSHFDTIARAIKYLEMNFKEQPSLEEIAKEVNLSPFHFQRIFTEWAGVSPKQFLQYLNVAYARKLLKEKQVTLFDAAVETGLSGTGRLHDMFIRIEGMTPGEYKNGGEKLSINYSFADTPFGSVIIASTEKGICYIAFFDDGALAFDELRNNFCNAKFLQRSDALQQDALQIFSGDWSKMTNIKLHLKGTPFQIKVWEALLKVPSGGLTTYSSLASIVNNPKASRAVGSAVGDNPVAYLIPCHRVIRSTGIFGQYHWGTSRKAAMIGWEAAKNVI